MEGTNEARTKSCMLVAKDVLAARGYDTLAVTENVRQTKKQGLVQDMENKKKDRPSVRAFLVLGCMRQHVERAECIKKRGHGYDIVLHESHPNTCLRLFNADECVREMFGLIDNLVKFTTPPAVTIFLKDEKHTKHQSAFDDIMRERVAKGGTVYEIVTRKLPDEEIATRMCEASIRSYTLLRT